MSYEKHTWENGEVITADKLNHLEDGIASADSSGTEVVVIELSAEDENTFVLSNATALCDAFDAMYLDPSVLNRYIIVLIDTEQDFACSYINYIDGFNGLTSHYTVASVITGGASGPSFEFCFNDYELLMPSSSSSSFTREDITEDDTLELTIENNLAPGPAPDSGLSS